MSLSTNPDVTVYRIIPLRFFKSLLDFKQLWFSNPIKVWKDDPHEGLLFKLLEIIEDIKHHPDRDLQAAAEGISRETIAKIRETVVPATVELSQALVYGQCWTTKDESAKMWQEYSDNCQGVRITTTWNALGRLIEDCFEADAKHAEIFKIDYFNCLDYDAVLNSIFTKNGYSFARAFQIKRAKYEYEDELRVLLRPNSVLGPMVNRKECFPDRFPADLNKLTIPLNKFILEVKLHPHALKSTAILVEQLCREYNLNYAGISSFPLDR